MPQFYFHLWHSGQLTPDEVGVDLPNLTAAKRRAERTAASLRDHNEGTPIDLIGWDIEVTDAVGRVVLIVPAGPGSLDTKPSRAA